MGVPFSTEWYRIAESAFFLWAYQSFVIPGIAGAGQHASFTAQAPALDGAWDSTNGLNRSGCFGEVRSLGHWCEEFDQRGLLFHVELPETGN